MRLFKVLYYSNIASKIIEKLREFKFKLLGLLKLNDSFSFYLWA